MGKDIPAIVPGAVPFTTRRGGVMFDPVEGSLRLGDFGPNTLELTGVPSVGYREMRATVRTPHLTAAITIHEHPDVGDFDQLGQLLAGFAADWRGWEGDRTWRSADTDLVLVCTHDQVGRVNVRVTLRNYEEGWELEAIEIVLELGRLDVLSRDVLSFFEALPSGGK
jgi:hypothetical protein